MILPVYAVTVMRLNIIKPDTITFSDADGDDLIDGDKVTNPFTASNPALNMWGKKFSLERLP